MAGMEDVTFDEDFVAYWLFPRLPTVKGRKSDQDVLQELLDSYTAHLSPYLIDYIWQKEPFALQVSDNAPGVLPPHLHGSTKFGDNIDDEWFIVFLLFELTKAFPDLIIRVTDNDGEFLLVEMAEDIPKWLNPDTAENRVFLHQGNVHIVPRPHESGPLSNLPAGAIALPDALTVVREYSSATKCNLKMQRSVLQRLGCFPDKIRENLHRAHCYLPAAAAAILQERPSLVSGAVTAFCQRDEVDAKACRSMKFFPPETRVMTEVRFTRCLYGQLVQQKYVVDTRVGWQLPSPRDPLYKAYDLGVKLACGFEILVNKARTSRLPSNGNTTDNSARWSRYVDALKDKGYFRGEVDGSKLYVELLTKAQRHFEEMVDSSVSGPGESVVHLLDSIDVDLEELQRREKTLPPADDDSWLDINPAQLEEILREKFCKSTKTIPEKLSNFMEQKSGIEGVEFPKLRQRENNRGNKSNRVTMDADGFADAMTSILDFKLPDWEEGSSSDMSEYSDEDGDSEPCDPDTTDRLKRYMEQMDNELDKTCIGQSFERKVKENGDALDEAGFDHYSPVDVDLTALCNIVESYRLQNGAPGPASNLMVSVEKNLPSKKD